MPSWSLRQERRRWRRHWLKAPVRLITGHGVIEGFGLRVSEGGMYLFALADLNPGTEVDVEFANPHSGERHRRSAIVRNRVVYLYGMEFMHDSAGAAAHAASGSSEM